MDIPAYIMEELKCSKCEIYLSQSPVYLQHDGTTTCGQCFSPEFPARRNKQYEAVAKLLQFRFPCKYQNFGCWETVAFTEGQDVTHDAACKYRQYVCPVLGSSRCDWLGPRSQILQHCEAEHPDRVVGNPCSLVHDITTSTLNNYALQAFHLLILLHTKICVTTRKIYHSVRLLDTSQLPQNFIFTLRIQRNKELLLKEGVVEPQGCLTLQEPTALALDIDSLLSVLGGWDGTTFIVTVLRRPMGSWYWDSAMMMVYRYSGGCRACKNQAHGCTHYSNKWWKHETYFCEQRTKCYICLEDIPRGTLSSHYASAHRDVMHSSGSTWRATGTPWQGWHCLVTCAAGTAVCWYELRDSHFDLSVHIPVLRQYESEFCCEVRVTQPTTRVTSVYRPLLTYDRPFDWRIVIKKHDFSTWSCELDVCVDISEFN